MPAGYELNRSWPDTTRGRITESARDDDTDYTVLGLHILESHGFGFGPEQVAREWLEHLPFLQVYTAERAAMANLVGGVAVPATARRRNPYRQWIGAQIRADMWGYVSPGDPAAAARLAFADASLSHVQNGIYGEQWAAALVAAAFGASGVREALDVALAYVPARSRLAEALRARRRVARRGARLGCRARPRSRRATASSARCTRSTTPRSSPPRSCGATGDFTRTIGLAVEGGWDTDCNGATAGSVFGAMHGAGRHSGALDRAPRRPSAQRALRLRRLAPLGARRAHARAGPLPPQRPPGRGRGDPGGSMTQSVKTVSRRTLLQRGAAGLVGAATLPGVLSAAAYARPSADRSFSYWYAVTSAKQEDWLKKDFATYEKANPDVSIDAAKRPLDSIDRLIATSLKASRGPDLIGTPGASYVATYADAGYLRSLDDYVKRYGWKDKLLPWALRSGEFGGHLYSVPTSYETMVIYYNKKLFADRGIKIPTTRQQLEALCQDLAADGITPFMAGSAEWRPATEWFVSVFLNHYAGPQAVYEGLSGKRPWTDPVFVDAITLMRDWFKKGWFGGGVDRYFSNRFPPQYANLGSGKAAMDLEGSWALTSMQDYFGPKAGNDADWDWFPVPPLSTHAPKRLYTLATGGTYSVNAKAEDPADIGAYLDWLFSTPKRVAQGVAEINNEPLPIHLKASDFPASTDKRVLRMYADIGKATGDGVFGYTTWTFWGPKSDVWSYQGMDKVLTGSQSPTDYLRRMTDLMKVELKQKKLPPLIPQGTAA